jgi:retron-type reverse transcriptase
MDTETLKRAFGRIRPKVAVGVDGVTKACFEENLEENLEGLREDMRRGTYRHQPIRRVHIPKENGKTQTSGHRNFSL